MKTSSCKNKGRLFQQWVRDRIIGIFNLEKDDVRSTSSGASGEDILLSPEARKVFPYSIECKNQERINVWNSYRQAVSNTVESIEPLLFIKRNHHKPLVVLDAEYFFYLNREIQLLKGKNLKE